MSVNTDAALTAVRDFFERSVRELQAKDEAMGRQASTASPFISCQASHTTLDFLTFACPTTSLEGGAVHAWTLPYWLAGLV